MWASPWRCSSCCSSSTGSSIPSLYIATYRESANRRVSLAETLRRLPLSFFGNRDLSDLTATMIADCSSLDQMFSHYVPQLFASIGSTLVIGACMFACDWAYGPGGAVGGARGGGADGGKQEDPGRLWDEKHPEQAGGGRLHPGGAGDHPGPQGLPPAGAVPERPGNKAGRHGGQLHPVRAGHRACSSAPPRLSCGWGLPPRCSPAGRCCWRGALFPLFLGFLFAAARLYDPLGVVLQNIAATFNTKLQIERMRSILEQPVQTGREDFHPSSYDITFDHVSFAYREGAGVLDDVSCHGQAGRSDRPSSAPPAGGKSTRCKLAARFWDVTGGKVSLGGTDVSRWTRRPSCAPTPWCSRTWCCSGTR